MARPVLTFALLSAVAAATPVHAQPRTVWIGTAPSCAATASDCTRRGMDYVRSDASGDGSRCWTGTKVLCRERQAAQDDIINVWIGTAPACNASPNDCQRSGLTYVRSSSSGDGATCFTGTKVLCQGPRSSYRPQTEGIGADVAQLKQAAANAAQTVKGSLVQGAQVVKAGFERYGCAFIRETNGAGGIAPFALSAQCGVPQAEAALRAIRSPQVQRFLSIVRQPLAAASNGASARIPAIERALQSGRLEDAIAAAGLGDVLAAVSQAGPAGGGGGGNMFDSKPSTRSSRSFNFRSNPEACATNFDAGYSNTASIGWTVIDASIMAGGTYEFGGVYRLPRGERTGRDHMLYHSGTFTMGMSGGVDTGFGFGFWCGTIPPVGMQKTWGVTVALTPGVGGGSFTLWFEGSFSEGTTTRMAGISFAISAGGSLEMEFARACTNYQLAGARSFGALTAECDNPGPVVRTVTGGSQSGPDVTNVALRKRTVQSSTILGGDAARAVDGLTSGVWGENSVTHTSNAPGNWWMVDLGAEYLIKDVLIYNRTDCCVERLNAQLAVTATEGWPSSTIRFQRDLGAARDRISVPVSNAGNVYGRYVYVLLNTADYLSLAEVEVLGIPSATVSSNSRSAQDVMNVALRKRTAQSSTVLGGDAARAVDGLTSGVWGENSVTHTSNSPGNWWMVDLGAEYLILDILVYNRTDCCKERLNAMLAVTGSEGWPVRDVRFEAELWPAQDRRHIPVKNSGNVYGRYIYVYLRGTEYLSLAEVEVMAIPR